MEMKGKTTSIQLGIEILTPVQCGSGQEMFKELDYVKKDQQVFVVDQIKSFNAIASGEQALDNLLVGGSSQLSDLVQLVGKPYGYRLPMIVGSGVVPDKIREHLKDAHFQPYLAGSALKGAIRTALIAEYLRSLNNSNYQRFLPNANDKPKPPKDKFADDKLLDNLLGKETKQDIFRALHVKDAMFKTEQLCLVDIRWLNLVSQANKETAHWRSMATRRSFPRWQDADGIHAEMLKPKSTANFHLQWDEFLLSDLSQWHGRQQNDILPRDFASLRNKLNAHTRHRLTQEKDFYHRYGALRPEQECQKLLNQLAKDSDSIYLQLSWGSGWRGMTGDWMNTDLANTMRELYNLGRNNMPYPKTRRLAVLGEPRFPLGWVRLFELTQNTESSAPSENGQAPQTPDNTQLSTLEKELQALKTVPEQEWDTRLLQKLEQATWSSEDQKQVAEKIKQLMINADKWCPDFTGSNKTKLKFKERSLKVQKFLD